MSPAEERAAGLADTANKALLALWADNEALEVVTRDYSEEPPSDHQLHSMREVLLATVSRLSETAQRTRAVAFNG